MNRPSSRITILKRKIFSPNNSGVSKRPTIFAGNQTGNAMKTLPTTTDKV